MNNVLLNFQDFQVYHGETVELGNETIVDCLKDKKIKKPRKKKTGNFPCKECGKIYKENYLLKNHMQTHEKSVNTCTKCSKVFSTPYRLSCHMLWHKQFGMYPCKHCSKTFHRKSNLRHHMWSHTKEKQVKCLECNQVLSSESSLKMHKFIKHSGTEPQFHCQQCPKKFKTKDSLKKHIGTTHTTILNFACDVCPKKFYNEPNLRRHKKRHIPKKFECVICYYDFKNERAFKEHTNEHKGILAYQCDQCLTRFYRKLELDHHVKVVHKGNGKSVEKLKCEICDYTCYLSTSLKYHSLIHFSNFNCPECNINYVSVYDFQKHNSEKHGKKMNECPICGEEFDIVKGLQDSKLRQHILNHKKSN